jgi:ABC-type nitrate/sulfonate/bicarbonate transport system substrate-binding protein
MITSKKIWVLAGIVLVVLVLTAVAIGLTEKPKTSGEQAEESAELAAGIKEIKIANVPKIFPYFPLFVAQQKNLFEANGLMAEFEQMETADALKALIEKEVDYMPSSPLTLEASLEETPIKTIMAFADGSPYYLVLQPGLELKDLKTIGVSSPHSGPHYQAMKLIEENDIPATVSFLGNSPAQHITALFEASVDGAVVTPPYVFLLREDGFTVLEPFGDVRVLFSGLTTRNEKIENNPEEVEKVIKTVQSAVEFIRTNPQETRDLLFEFFELEKNEKNEKAVEDTYLFMKGYFSTEGTLDEETIREVIQFAKTEQFASFKDVKNQSVSPEEIAKAFDFSLLEEE